MQEIYENLSEYNPNLYSLEAIRCVKPLDLSKDFIQEKYVSNIFLGCTHSRCGRNREMCWISGMFAGDSDVLERRRSYSYAALSSLSLFLFQRQKSVVIVKHFVRSYCCICIPVFVVSHFSNEQPQDYYCPCCEGVCQGSSHCALSCVV